MTDKTDHDQHDENRLIAERRGKLAELREQGQAFPNTFKPEHTAAGLQSEYGDSEAWPQEKLQAEKVPASVAGRMLSRRIMGKAAFVHIRDRSGAQIQLYLRRDDLPEGVYQAFKHWDVGDIVGAAGVLMRTRPASSASTPIGSSCWSNRSDRCRRNGTGCRIRKRATASVMWI